MITGPYLLPCLKHVAAHYITAGGWQLVICCVPAHKAQLVSHERMALLQLAASPLQQAPNAGMAWTNKGSHELPDVGVSSAMDSSAALSEASDAGFWSDIANISPAISSKTVWWMTLL